MTVVDQDRKDKVLAMSAQHERTTRTTAELEQLALRVIDAQQVRVFKAINKERTSGTGMDRGVSVELKRLMGYIVAFHEMRRAPEQDTLTPKHGPGIISEMLAAVFEDKPRKRKSVLANTDPQRPRQPRVRPEGGRATLSPP